MNTDKNEVFIGLQTEYYYLVAEINLKLMYSHLRILF